MGIYVLYSSVFTKECCAQIEILYTICVLALAFVVSFGRFSQFTSNQQYSKAGCDYNHGVHPLRVFAIHRIAL